MKIIAFFNNQGGLGKTTLVYHLAWIYAELGLSVLAADLDPQANLTSMFLEDERLESLWAEEGPRRTIFGSLQPLLKGTADIAVPHVEQAGPGLGLVVGDLSLSAVEDDLSSQWLDSLDRKPRAFRVLSALWRALRLAAEETEAALVLMDIGPNLGAFNRAALVASDFVVVPLAPDLYCLQGLRDLGPTLRRWRCEWAERLVRNPLESLEMPGGAMCPAGYIVMQSAVRPDRPVKTSERWMQRIPDLYREAVLGEGRQAGVTLDSDPHCLSTVKHYPSLISLAQEARKPMFALKPADGAIGGHAQAVQDCLRGFRALARAVAGPCGVALP